MAEQAARRAGEILEDWADRFTVREKGRSDLVTEADSAAQQAIFEIIRGRFPDHGFLGEEDGLNVSAEKSGYRWIIDPLDGTSNYVHRFPYYCVSIGLEENGRLIVGAIFDPNRNEMFSAVAGQGATLNGKPIRPTPTDRLQDSMVVASLPVASRPDNPAVKRFLDVMPHVQTVQRTGSAALNLAYIACGRIDAFWSTSLKPWDMAAGAVLVEAAGGRISKMDGGPFDVSVADLLSSNGTEIHDHLRDVLA